MLIRPIIFKSPFFKTCRRSAFSFFINEPIFYNIKCKNTAVYVTAAQRWSTSNHLIGIFFTVDNQSWFIFVIRKNKQIVTYFEMIETSPYTYVTFVMQVFLNIHLKGHIESVHEGKKLFKCKICDSSFTQKRYMNRHIESVHEGKKPF